MRWTVRDNGDRSTPRSPFGVTGELQDGPTGLVYLRARWYDPAQGRFLQRDSFTGGPTRPQSLNRYAYTEHNPVNWTDPSGRCVGWVWRDPTCQFIGWDRTLRGDLEWAEAIPWAGAGVDFSPVGGDLKGFIEVFTGRDLVTGEDLGAWRWAGLVFLSELRHLRHLDTVGRAARGLGAVPGGQMPGHTAVPTGGMRQYIGVREEGGIANSIIEGVVSIAEQRRLARYIAKRHGTRVLLRDPVGIGRNAFDPTTNTIHLRHPRNNLPRGVYYEEIQHALDFHARRYEGLWPLPHPLSPSYRVENSKLHIITFRQIAKNEHGWFNLTAGQINDLLKKADDWEKSLIP